MLLPGDSSLVALNARELGSEALLRGRKICVLVDTRTDVPPGTTSRLQLDSSSVFLDYFIILTNVFLPKRTVRRLFLFARLSLETSSDRENVEQYTDRFRGEGAKQCQCVRFILRDDHVYRNYFCFL